MTKKKLQDDVLFEEQDIITPKGASSNSVEDDASLRLLHTQERLLTNYELMQQKMDESEKQITRLTKDITDFKDKQEAFVREMDEKYHIHFDPTPESIEAFRGILREETNGFKNETRKCTITELKRLKNAYGDEEDNINVLRIRW